METACDKKPEGGGGTPTYMPYEEGMCSCEVYVFQAFYSQGLGINQWVLISSGIKFPFLFQFITRYWRKARLSCA